MINFTINEIFFKIDGLSRLFNVELDYAAKNFYFSLLEYCDKNGSFDKDMNAFYVDLSVTSLCKIFGLSSHTVQSSISSLLACELIDRVKYNPSFSKLSTGKYSTNKPSRIYIKLDSLKE